MDYFEDKFELAPALYGLDYCWQWTGGAMQGGRGMRYGYPVVNGKHVLAHRLAWELSHNRKIPKGKLVRHRCDNSLCINPEHLVLGTQHDNAMDAVKRGRHGNSRISALTCRRGHPRTPENTQTFIRKDRGRLERRCRTCNNARAMQSRKSLQSID